MMVSLVDSRTHSPLLCFVVVCLSQLFPHTGSAKDQGATGKRGTLTANLGTLLQQTGLVPRPEAKNLDMNDRAVWTRFEKELGEFSIQFVDTVEKSVDSAVYQFARNGAPLVSARRIARKRSAKEVKSNDAMLIGHINARVLSCYLNKKEGVKELWLQLRVEFRSDAWLSLGPNATGGSYSLLVPVNVSAHSFAKPARPAPTKRKP